MILFEGPSGSDIYRYMMVSILEDGDDVDVRGFKTREIYNAVTEITRPDRRVHIVPGRRWNPWVALSESLWILAGRQDIYPLLPYNKRISQFSDDGNTLAGAYGWRIRRQLKPLIKRLQDDPFDRRAILSIWRENDLWADTKDPPCNDLVMFKQRNGYLHMTVMNRSNDLHWGLFAVNLTSFSILQEYLAHYLGYQIGFQTHVSNSLHIYLDGPNMKANTRITDNMLIAMKERQKTVPWGYPIFKERPDPDTLSRDCSQVLNQNKNPYEGIEFLEFCDDFLQSYEDSGVSVRHADKWPDWMLAAEVWRQG